MDTDSTAGGPRKAAFSEPQSHTCKMVIITLIYLSGLL